jgi:hypothetical protein
LAKVLFCTWYLWNSYSWWALLIGFLISGFTQILGLMVFILSLFLLAASGATLNTLLFKPLAWILERENPGIPIKIISVILLLLGFHFDLLAS